MHRQRAATVAISAAAKWARLVLTQERLRWRLLAAFVAAHFVALFLLPVSHPIDLALPVPNDWLSNLSLYKQRSAGSNYAGGLLIAVAILGAVQLLRPRPIYLARWLWIIGWVSVAGSAVSIAFIDLSERIDLESLILGETLPLAWRAVVASAAALLLAPGSYVFWVSQRGHPARALLTALAFMLAVGSFVRDHLTKIYVGNWWNYDYLSNFLEETWEFLAVLIVIVVFIDMSTARHRLSVGDSTLDRQAVGRRWMWIVSAMAVTPLLLLSIYATNLYVERMDMVFEGKIIGSGLPRSYTGPISLVEQGFQVDQDNISRIKVWSYVDGGAEGEAAEVFARLTPTGSNQAIRESRAEVRGSRFSNTSVDFAFEPIPESGGKVYTLTIGVLGDSRPWVFLGLADGDLNPEGAAIVSGEPEQHGSALAMTTYWTGRAFLTHMGGADSDPRRIAFAVDLAVTTFLWIFAAFATERGISGCQPRFWNGYVVDTLWRSLLVTSGIAILGMLLLPMLLAGRPHV